MAAFWDVKPFSLAFGYLPNFITSQSRSGSFRDLHALDFVLPVRRCCLSQFLLIMYSRCTHRETRWRCMGKL